MVYANLLEVTPSKLDSPFLNNTIEDERPALKAQDRKFSMPDISSSTSTKKEMFTQFLQSSKTKSKTPPPSSPVTDDKKSRIPPLLRKMSSLSKKSSTKTSRSPSPVEVEKITLITGWVNVQLPETMLWKRRYLKLESDGWLFLALNEDEVRLSFFPLKLVL